MTGGAQSRIICVRTIGRCIANTGLHGLRYGFSVWTKNGSVRGWYFSGQGEFAAEAFFGSKVFVLILSMTGGGPGYYTEVPVTRILASMIGSSRFGYACTQGIMFGAILLVISFIQIRLSKYMRQA